jgi:lipopolysaccharide export system permease protein
MILAFYLLRLHLGPFLFGSITVMFLFLLQFLMNNMDKLLGKGLDTSVILQVILLSLAWMVVLAIPMGVLFSTLMAFGSMAAAQELTIIRSGGRSLWRMMLPLIIIGAGLFYAMYWFNDKVLPESNHQFKVLMQDIQRKKPTFSIEAGQFSTQLEGYTILSRKVDSATGSLLGVTVYDNGQLNRMNVVSADSGIISFSDDYSRLMVTLHHGEIHQIHRQQKGDFRIIRFDHHQIAIPARDFLFTRSDAALSSRGDREMSISDMRIVVNEADSGIALSRKRSDRSLNLHFNDIMLGKLADSLPLGALAGTIKFQPVSRSEAIQRAINKLTVFRSQLETDLHQAAEQDQRRRAYLVEIYKKYSIPCACLVFVFIGCPLGMMTKRGNFGISAAISLLFYVIFWACLIGGEKLADRNMISPEAGGWFCIAVTGTLGLLLTTRMNNENPLFSFLFKKS